MLLPFSPLEVGFSQQTLLLFGIASLAQRHCVAHVRRCGIAPRIALLRSRPLRRHRPVRSRPTRAGLPVIVIANPRAREHIAGANCLCLATNFELNEPARGRAWTADLSDIEYIIGHSRGSVPRAGLSPSLSVIVSNPCQFL